MTDFTVIAFYFRHSTRNLLGTRRRPGCYSWRCNDWSVRCCPIILWRRTSFFSRLFCLSNNARFCKEKRKEKQRMDADWYERRSLVGTEDLTLINRQRETQSSVLKYHGYSLFYATIYFCNRIEVNFKWGIRSNKVPVQIWTFCDNRSILARSDTDVYVL